MQTQKVKVLVGTITHGHEEQFKMVPALGMDGKPVQMSVSAGFSSPRATRQGETCDLDEATIKQIQARDRIESERIGRDFRTIEVLK